MAMDGAEPGADLLLEAGVAVSSGELDAARLGFHQRFPKRSAKRVFFATQTIALLALISGLIWATLEAPALTLTVLHLAAFALFAIVIGFRLVAAAQLQPVLSRLAEPETWPTYTILCPLYREANVAPDLVAAISEIDYPGIMAQTPPANRSVLALV